MAAPNLLQHCYHMLRAQVLALLVDVSRSCDCESHCAAAAHCWRHVHTSLRTRYLCHAACCAPLAPRTSPLSASCASLSLTTSRITDVHVYASPAAAGSYLSACPHTDRHLAHAATLGSARHCDGRRATSIAAAILRWLRLVVGDRRRPRRLAPQQQAVAHDSERGDAHQCAREGRGECHAQAGQQRACTPNISADCLCAPRFRIQNVGSAVKFLTDFILKCLYIYEASGQSLHGQCACIQHALCTARCRANTRPNLFVQAANLL